jgi:hypothetical protein
VAFRVGANLQVRLVGQKGASWAALVGRKKQLVGQYRHDCHFVKNLAFSISFDENHRCCGGHFFLVNTALKWRKPTAIQPLNRFQRAFVQT